MGLSPAEMLSDELIVFTGGAYATNAYLIPTLDGTYLCVDAPVDLLKHLKSRNIKISALLLTHGHFDHVWDAGMVEEAFQCPIYGHPTDFPMIMNPGYLVKFGIKETYLVPKKMEPLLPPEKGAMSWSNHGFEFTLFHVPGHCPGSVAFYLPAEKSVFGGDVLFSGGVGRWDLPGGSQAELLNSIRTHFLTLPDETIVYPGHGPETTIGVERAGNPYLK